MDRLFDWRSAFDHPVTVAVTLGAVSALVLAPLVAFLLSRLGRISPETRRDILARTVSWAVLVPLLVGPVLLGAAWTMLGVTVLGLLCHGEYARATGYFRERSLCLLVILGILALNFAVLDHWYGFFVAVTPLTIALLCIGAVLPDRPQGFVQRLALAILGFMLFGCCLGHLGYMANDSGYRPVILLTVVCVELNDVFAYVCGKGFGHTRMTPRTSPNKTVGGFVGAMLLTTGLVWLMGRSAFAGTPMEQDGRLLLLGALVSLSGQFGDLLLSSIKRDIGVKDLGTLLPGMGGLLDRFDSLLLAAPVVFHYVGYYNGFGLDQPTRILTGR